MVVGDGMIATAFLNTGRDYPEKIIFASGVSNSHETDPAEFRKETELLLSFAPTGDKLVYFSTVSVLDPSMADYPYIFHKRGMEKAIQENFTDYLVIRLPIVVGKSANPHTLANWLYHCISAGEPFNLYQQASRYLIDIEDVVRLVDHMLLKTSGNHIINLVLDNKMKVTEIAAMMQEISGKKSNYKLIDKGSDYSIDNSEAKLIIGPEEFKVDSYSYNFRLLKKYYGN